MSSLIFLTITTLLVLNLLPLSTAFLVDLDGDNLRYARLYYIVVSATGKGLTYTQRNNECPLYITSTTAENSLGTPVKISTRLRKTFISVDAHVTLGFVKSDETKLPCKGLLTWKATRNTSSNEVYITTGGGSILTELSFVITKTDRSLSPTFELQYCDYTSEEEECDYLGLFGNGLLGTTRYPTIISFKKAFNVPQISTS